MQKTPVISTLFALTLLTSHLAGAKDPVYKTNEQLTAQAQWQPKEVIRDGFCSQSGTWCQRVFLGITENNKILIQDFYTEPATHLQNVIRDEKTGELLSASYDPYTGIIDSKMTDPFTVLTVEDASNQLFYLEDGRDGPYRQYNQFGDVTNEGSFQNGLKQGEWKTYFLDGNFSYEHYNKGRLDGSALSKIGNIIFEESYTNGQLTVNSHIDIPDFNLPITSDQFSKYSVQKSEIYEFYLPSEYQNMLNRFKQQEIATPVKGTHFGSEFVTENLRYLTLGTFKIDDYLYELIAYNRDDDSDIVLLNIQLNSYDQSRYDIIDSLLLSSQFAFEDIERYSQFTIDNKTIDITHYIRTIFRTEIINGQEVTIMNVDPQPEVYQKEQYQIKDGQFIVIEPVKN
ncbi:toxin-antitoxin system YwqK family antitoxin [Zophobihabitans entericus]|uniref:Uncharacterized protein n=1 Tax=Zophobihabitans entericus TaxID=1635327 RepID=A0A6G9IBQ9_9GAMM|nr:hypothetical protein [Zophobihabitans entericus]QIQ21668.1 hypothetical protein IPMB12_08240 [Zophobihabitans entericus]